jgi:hypothetical protein
MEWRFVISAKQFAALRGEESFRQILALGRLLNSLRFLQISFLGAQSDQPAGARQRIGAFFFMSAVLYEGFELLKRMAKHFRDFEAWKKRIAPILSDQLFEHLYAKSLGPLRNQAVFHFFEDALEEPLAHCDLNELVLVSGVGPAQGGVHYELSDLLALDLFIAEYGSAEEHLKRADLLMTRTKDLLLDVVGASEALITEYAESQNFVPAGRSRVDNGAA